MSKFEPNKFLVVNRKHLDKIPGWKCGLVALALRFINDHVSENKYYVCNQDESYADKVINIILDGEKTVTIFEPQSNDTWPYFTCPKCGNQNITRAFQRCIDCGARIVWEKRKIRTLKEMGG